MVRQLRGENVDEHKSQMYLRCYLVHLWLLLTEQVQTPTWII